MTLPRISAAPAFGDYLVFMDECGFLGAEGVPMIAQAQKAKGPGFHRGQAPTGNFQSACVIYAWAPRLGQCRIGQPAVAGLCERRTRRREGAKE